MPSGEICGDDTATSLRNASNVSGFGPVGDGEGDGFDPDGDGDGATGDDGPGAGEGDDVDAGDDAGNGASGGAAPSAPATTRTAVLRRSAPGSRPITRYRPTERL